MEPDTLMSLAVTVPPESVEPRMTRFEPGLEIVDVGGQAEDGHDLGGHGDVEPGLALDALAALPDGDLAERPVVEVDHARPGDVVGVDVELVALEQMVVEHRGAQVVGGGDGVDVAGEVEVDVLHGDHLGVAAAGRSALDAEARAQRGLAQRADGLLADLVQAHRETHVGRGLALAGRSGRDGGAEHQLAVRTILQAVEDVQVDLGLVLAVGIQVVRAEPQPGGDLGDRDHRGFACDLDIALHASPFLQRSLRINGGGLPLRPFPRGPSLFGAAIVAI